MAFVAARLRPPMAGSGRTNLVRRRSGEPEILTFLLRNGVPWPFILTNWNLSLSDTSLFIAGVAAGAAEDFIDALRFMAKLAASPYIDNIAEVAEKLGLIDDAQVNLQQLTAGADGVGARLDITV